MDGFHHLNLMICCSWPVKIEVLVQTWHRVLKCWEAGLQDAALANAVANPFRAFFIIVARCQNCLSLDTHHELSPVRSRDGGEHAD